MIKKMKHIEQLKSEILLLLGLGACFLYAFHPPAADLKKEKAFEHYLHDSIPMQVDLVYDQNNLPDHYYSYVRSPVCDDGLCKLVHIKLYWDLLGNFKDYETPDGLPLTKFDHLEFTREDYLKLTSILADQNSLLKDYEVDELIDPDTEVVSETVDAVTGATKETVKKAVVSGAVYSTYVIWHIVNGEVTAKMQEHTASTMNEPLLKKFMLSDNHHYHYYALDQLQQDDLTQLVDETGTMLSQANVFVARNIINRLSEEALITEAWQLKLVELYPDLEYQAQQLVLDRLKNVQLAASTLQNLAELLARQSARQVETILTLMVKNEENLTKQVLAAIAKLPYEMNPILAEAGYEAILKLNKKNKDIKKAIKYYEQNY